MCRGAVTSRCTRSGISAWVIARLSGLARSTASECYSLTTTRTQEKPLDTTPKYCKQSPTLTLGTSGRTTDVIVTSVVRVKLDETRVSAWVFGPSTLLPDQTLTTVSRLLEASSPNAGLT